MTDILEREVEAIYDTTTHFGLESSKTEVRQLCFERPSYSEVIRGLGLELTEEIFDYWSSAFVKRYPLSVLREGTKPTLDSLSQEYTLFCVTSRESVAEVKSELNFFDLEDAFSQIVTREVAARHFGLPHLPFVPFHEQRRKLYECALVLVDCHSVDALVVGDMASELRPAKHLGILTVGLLTEKAKETELKEVADYVIPDLRRLHKILHELADFRHFNK